MSETSIVATTQQQDVEEEDENRKVWFVVCCNLCLFIIMIILLLLLMVRYNAYDEEGAATASPSYKPAVSGNGGGGPATTAAATDVNVTSSEAATTTPAIISALSTAELATTTVMTSASSMSSTALLMSTPTVAPSIASTRNMTSSTTSPTTSTAAPTAPITTAGPSVKNYTLICVFETISVRLWNRNYSCTDYVYIRFFVYSTNPDPSAALVFEGKRKTEGSVHLYYDQSNAEWRQYSYRVLDARIKTIKRHHPNSRYYLGMWGAAYIRLMSGLWDPKTLREALHRTLRSNYSHILNTSDFNGFAIINSVIQDTRPRGRAEPFSTVFHGSQHGAPILEPHWTLIHTAAIWPGGDTSIPEKMVSDILKEADIVGISTSNSTDEPNILMGRVGNTAAYLAASPPNPINPPGPNTRGMLDILAEFPHWKQVLGRSKLCFSVTTAINYAYTSVDGIDFIRPVREKEHVQRYSRRRFTSKNATVGYPVEEQNMVYYYDNTTHTHYWRHRPPPGQLLKFFAYDDAVTLKYKVAELLRAYPSDRCIVFDDLGEDRLSANLTTGGQTYEFKSYAMFEAVVDVLNATTT